LVKSNANAVTTTRMTISDSSMDSAFPLVAAGRYAVQANTS
jgi:hypothetical protein